MPEEQYRQWYEEQQAQAYEPGPEETGTFPIPAGPGRTRQLGEGHAPQPEQLPIPAPREEQSEVPAQVPVPVPAPVPDEKAQEEAYYQVFRQSIDGSFPTPRVLGDNIEATYGTTLSPSALKNLTERFQNRFNAELEEDHIA